MPCSLDRWEANKQQSAVLEYGFRNELLDRTLNSNTILKLFEIIHKL
jgi:hypothetical protein